MKGYILFFIMFSANLFGQHADSLFLKANKLYQQEKYADALDLYAEIESNKIISDALFYNMANAYYKQNKVAWSIYYYEKTLLLNPNHSDARYNLGFAKQMAIDNIEPLPKSISQKVRSVLIQKLHYNSWAWMAVCMAFLFALLFLLYHFSYISVKKRIYFISSIISAFLALVFVLFAYQNYNFVKFDKQAIIFAQQSAIKSAPTKSSEISFELHEGTKVQILETLDNWKKIKIADGKIGWIDASDLKELN